jgi:hypothetical protein
LCASDNSCLTHIAALAEKSKTKNSANSHFEIKHIAEILASTKATD